ncbi:MAG: TatD family hydrolase [Clostridia bacterium]|nr:TatD family hydrolase [Clostridia bacterium]
MRLFDTHAHLTSERFKSDRDEVIQRLTEAGVELVLLVGDASVEDQPVYPLAEAHPNFYAATGVHPHEASAWNEEVSERIIRWMAHPKSVALGEIGLDYYYDLSPREIQRQAFDEQLELAYQLKKPVILHVREAHGDATDMLTARVKAGRMPAGVMHCYTGSWESAKQYLNMGLYISFTGAVTFKNAPKLSEVAANLPADRILVETDCPYMTPVPLRGKRNEPAFVVHTAEKIAEIRGVSPEEFALQALENGKRLFGI